MRQIKPNIYAVGAIDWDARLFDRLIPLVASQLRRLMTRSHPELERPLAEVFQGALAGLADRKTDVMSEVAEVYARIFTLEELEAIARFYRSEVGRKYVEAAPKLTAEALRIGQKWGEIISRELRTKVKQEMRARGHKI